MDGLDAQLAGRRAWRGIPVVGVVVLALALGLWWFVRSGWLTTWRAIADDDELDDDTDEAVDRSVDADALSRATTEGMGTAFAGMSPLSTDRS